MLATFPVLQFYEFNSKHSCNKYCDMMSLKVFDENGIIGLRNGAYSVIPP